MSSYSHPGYPPRPFDLHRAILGVGRALKVLDSLQWLHIVPTSLSQLGLGIRWHEYALDSWISPCVACYSFCMLCYCVIRCFVNKDACRICHLNGALSCSYLLNLTSCSPKHLCILFLLNAIMLPLRASSDCRAHLCGG